MMTLIRWAWKQPSFKENVKVHYKTQKIASKFWWLRFIQKLRFYKKNKGSSTLCEVTNENKQETQVKMRI